MNRRIAILGGLLLVQVLVIALVFWPRATASGGAGQSLFPGVAAEKIVQATITAADGQSIKLAFIDGAWVMPDADNYPLQENKGANLAKKIAGLVAERPVAETAASHKRLKVAEGEFERRIDFSLDDGTTHTLYVGSSPSYGATHVRADDRPEVYLASDLSTVDVGAGASSWVDPTFFSVPRDQVTGVTLENAKGPLEFEKSGESWNLKGLAGGETQDTTKVQSLVSRALSVSMVRPLGKQEQPAYGLATPTATVTIRTTDSAGLAKDYQLRVGAKDTTDNTYVVASSESPYYVRVSEYAVKDLVEKARGDLLQAPPTAEPTGTTTP